MDEFALCWNNFQDNIATGFQNLYDRGDLVDVTLACDGKLLQAHKIVLAICSPYFQEMFITNPCKHPIIILKDVSFAVMTELLQFMYQGEVNVKHSELSTFMKIAETLQIKGLTTTQKSPTPLSHNNNQSSKLILNEAQSSNTPEPRGGGSSGSGGGGNCNSSNFAGGPKLENVSTPSSSVHPSKRTNDYSNDAFSIYPKKSKRIIESGNDSDINQDTIDNMASDEVFLPTIPQISMGESRFDLNNVKRESNDSLNSPLNMRNVAPSGFNYEYSNSAYSGKNIEYPNDLHDFPKAFNHMDIPAGSNITMLSSTSLLHGSCIFNRNNTVATQQGMKTYWLCKSYRITMCRARCITHQGRVISATGVHNHQPHMKGAHGSTSEVVPPVGISVSSTTTNTSNNVNNSNNNRHSIPNPPPSPDHHMNSQPPPPLQHQQSQQQHHQQQQQQHQQQQHQHQQHQQQQAQQQQQHHQHQQHQAQQVHLHPALQNSHHPHIQQLTHPPQGVQSNAVTLHNMMHNVLAQNNLMHTHPLSSIHQSIAMGPLLNPLQQHSQINNLHPPTTLQITPIIHHNVNLQSPSHPAVRASSTTQQSSQQQQQQQQDSPNIHHSHPMSSTPNNPNSNMSAVSSSPMATSTPNDENCVNIHQQQDNCSASQSGLISSITISPTAPSFKMEHI